MKIETLKQCTYGNTEYMAGKVFDVPDGIAADMILNHDAKLLGDSTRTLIKRYKGIEGKFKKPRGKDKPADPIKIKKSKAS